MTSLRKPILIALATLGIVAGTSYAHAEAPAPAAVTAPAGSAAPTPAPTAEAKPSDGISDPLEHPGDAIEDLRAAKRQGWALALLMGLVMATRIVARLPGSLGAWFRGGRRAMIVAIAGAGSIAAFDALALGGTWTSVLFAAGGAVLALCNPLPDGPPTKEPPGLAKAVA